MLNQKDIIAQNIKIQSNKEVSIINNDDDEEDYIYSALTVEGGGVFKKGIAIGIQEKMISGLIIYDNENFYGFSEKYGLSLLSPHSEYSELDIPNNIFENKSDNKLQPVQNNGDNFQNLKDTETNKSLNIDLQIKDVNNFYIIIPKEYSTTKSTLTFYIKYIYDLDSIISNISLVFINESNKSAFFEIVNDNCYYENDFNKELYKDSVNKIYTDIINSDYFIINKKSFFKHS